MNSDIRSMGISGVKWASIGRFSSQGISFVLGLILARLLLPSDYGMLDCSTVFYYNLGASLLVYMVMFLGAPFIADFYKQPLLTNVTRIACLTIPIGALCSVHSNLLYCQLRF